LAYSTRTLAHTTCSKLRPGLPHLNLRHVLTHLMLWPRPKTLFHLWLGPTTLLDLRLRLTSLNLWLDSTILDLWSNHLVSKFGQGRLSSTFRSNQLRPFDADQLSSTMVKGLDKLALVEGRKKLLMSKG